ncbi:MAG: hypothetical protein EON47_08610 [Acetobacteraceae bacterium]|nr:MAG: hypothetical protein EON47_08610 [Acetobacteraceae bacterium]
MLPLEAQMGFVLIGHDGEDADAATRREAAREPHLASIHRNAAAGRLVMSGPRLRPDGSTAGSLQVFEVPAQADMETYLEQEPFVAKGVWARVEVLPFRIAPMPWAPQPGRPGGEAGPLFAYAVTARDGIDAEAPQRRQAARPRHLVRIGPEVAAGRLRLGGALLDSPDGSMVGSIIALALPDEDAVREWLAAEPYVTEGVWQDIRIERWRISAQPYPALPGQAA